MYKVRKYLIALTVLLGTITGFVVSMIPAPPEKHPCNPNPTLDFQCKCKTGCKCGLLQCPCFEDCKCEGESTKGCCK